MKNEGRATLRAIFAWVTSVMLVLQLLGVDASRAFAQTVTETAENAATLGVASQGDAEKTDAQAPARPAFDREADLDGTRVHVSAAEGTFPEDAKLDVASPQGEEAERATNLVASARPEGMEPQTSEIMAVRVLSAGGEVLQTAEGTKATVTIEREGLLADGREAHVYEVSGNAATPLEQRVEGDAVTVEVALPASLALEVVSAGATEPAESSGSEAVEGPVEPDPGTEPGTDPATEPDSTPTPEDAADGANKEVAEPGNEDAAENPVEGAKKPTAGSSVESAQPSGAQQLGTQSTPTMTPQAEFAYYIDEDGNRKSAEWCTDFSSIQDQEGAQLQAGWYVVTSSRTFHNRISVTGNANLILGDGVTLTFERGIHIIQRYSPRLHVWCQQGRSGKLVATGGADQAGIGGNDGESSGALVVHGGTVEATGGDEAAGIGGGNEADCGIVDIRGGTVIAKATGKYGAGIGGGDQGAGGTVTISQSTAANGIKTKVTATGADYGAGIGSGDEADGDSGTVTILGGTVEATGGVEAAGIGSGNECGGGVGTVTISGGTVTATGKDLGAGIGGGDNVSNGVTKILGGTVTANGGYGAAGIGGGEDGHGGTVDISGGTVRAYGETTMIAGTIYSGAGIGGGDCGNGGTVTISGGSVTAVGDDRCAGIGGGNTGNGGTVNISGGTVDARGGNEAAGIGGSINGDGGTVTIGGDANVTVHGGKHAAGIGGGSGSDAKGADVTIEHAATVTVFVNSDGMSGVQAIGHGKHGTDEGSIIVRPGERLFYNKNAPSASGAIAAYVGQQYDACHSYYVRIEPCTHPSGLGNNPTYSNETTHSYNCIYCVYNTYGEGPHIYDEDGNCPCGAQKINFVYSENGGENRSTTVTEIYNAAGHFDTTYVIKSPEWEQPHYDFNNWLCEGNGKSCVLAPGAYMRYSDLKQYMVPGGGAHTLNLKAQWQQRYGTMRINSVLKSPVPTDQNLNFVYRVRLDDTSFNQTISGIKFTDGESETFLVGRQPQTILGLPEGVGYTVIQDGPAGDSLSKDDFLTKGSHYIGTTSSELSDVTFTNTRRQGSLALSVEVKSPIATDGDKGFPVEVRATGNEANSFAGTYGDLVFEGGVASLTLADGQTALATDLPSGTYTVKWGADNDFTREPSEDSQTISVEGVGDNQQPVAPVEASATYTRKSGELKVMKEVQGGTLSDSERPFALTVTLSDPSINGTFGEGDTAMTFVDGVAKFSLKHEESRIATGLPRGVGYTVEETPVAGFEAYKYGVAGTIGEWRSEARFTSAHQQGDLEVALAVKSSTAADKTKAFSVVARLSDATVSGWYGDMLFRDGVATFTLCDGESKVAEGLPAGVDYEVSQAELPGFSLTTSGTTGAIEAVKARATLTNVRAEGGLLVSASVTSPIASERGRSFPVTVKLTDLDSLNGTYGEMTFKNGQATFTIGDGGARFATGLPAGTGYMVMTDAGTEFEGTVEGSEGSLSATESSRVQIAYARMTGSVEVSNEVIQGSNSDNQRPFSYTMELSDRSLSGTYGDLEFVDGVASFTLSHGQKKAVEGLPTGIVCTVRQEQLAGFTTDSLEKVAAVPAEAQALAFTNTRQTGTLTVSNAVTGGSATTFNYTVHLSDTSVRGTHGGMEFDHAGAATFTLGNGESKTASGLPAGVTYTVEQTPVDGYLTTSSGAAGSIGTAESTASFSNTYAASGLVVSNQVVSDVPADHGASKTFQFTVKVSGEDVAGRTVGDVQFDENGQTTFSLADGQAKALTGLPVGASYVVSQVADGDFRSGAVDWPSGTVPAKGAATVAWRNVRKTGGLRISNGVESYLPADASREFIYTVTLRDTVTLQDVPITGTYGGLRFVDGRATKMLRGHQTVTAEGLPAGVTYRVEQKADAGFDTTWSGNDDQVVTGLVATGLVAATGEPVATAAFSNVRKNAMLTVTNSVRNNEDEPIDGVEFGYVVTLSDRGVSAKFGDLLFQNGVARFGLVNGQFKMISGLPQGMGYTVSQQPAIGFATSATGESGIIGSAGATASFTNTPLQQTAVLQVKKTVAGEGYDGNESFTFRLAKQDAAIGDILPDVRTATAGNGGTANFAPITFVQPGVYYYTISEVSPLAPFANMGYNTSTYWARVVVTRTSSEQNGPALQTKVTYGPSKAEATQEELTITNEYNHPPLTVSFEKNDGSAVDKQSVAYGSTVAKPSDPTRAGHTFKGWYVDQALGKAYSFRAKVTQDLTLYAKWNVNFYTVEFESNGGSNVEAQGMTYGSKVTKPANPTRAEHTFVGWFTDAKLTKAYDFSSEVTANLTLYAKWQANVSAHTHAVAARVVPEGAGTVGLDALQVAEGATVGIEATGNEGYEFAGWTVDGAGASIDDATSPSAMLTMGTADATVTANFRKKGEPAPTPTPTPAGDVVPALSGHVQNVGDVAGEPSGRGAKVGTEGRSLRLENFAVSLPKDVEGGIEYRAHVQNVGWDSWVADGAPCGTTSRSLRLEALQVRLAGKLADTHSVWYRVHAQNVGTMGWARDGQAAGTAGQSLRLESIEVQVLPKGEAPSDYAEGQASYVGAVSANVHVQNRGWTGSRSALEFGTTGQSRRLEAVRLGIGSQPVPGGIEYEVHAENRGWMPAAADGAMAGTTGQSRRLEAVRVRLTGEAAQEGNYSVWYRVHSQNQGWLGWAHDGQDAGTSGLSLRAEAIDVQVLPQGQLPRGYDASRAACVNG